MALIAVRDDVYNGTEVRPRCVALVGGSAANDSGVN